MKKLIKPIWIILIILTYTGCEIDNNPIRIVLMESSSPEVFSQDEVKIYVQAVDGDGDKISYSWGSSGGEFKVQKDTAYWIAPNQGGFYNITCKVSDGVGSSDAMSIPVKVLPLTPVPVNGLEWTLEDNGLLNGPNSSNNDNNGINNFWDGLVENAQYGWNITAPYEVANEISQSLQFKVEDSANCGGTNDKEQRGKATANIYINGETPVVLEINFSGIGEAQSAGYDLIEFELNGLVIGSGQAPGGGQGCVSDSVTVIPAAPQTLNPGAHSLIIDFTTNDGLYHVGAYYEIELKLSLEN